MYAKKQNFIFCRIMGWPWLGLEWSGHDNITSRSESAERFVRLFNHVVTVDVRLRC